jgi:hypothetical protein
VVYAFNNYGREKMGVLSRYEMTLERSLYKALHELQRLQAARAYALTCTSCREIGK